MVPRRGLYLVAKSLIPEQIFTRTITKSNNSSNRIQCQAPFEVEGRGRVDCDLPIYDDADARRLSNARRVTKT